MDPKISKWINWIELIKEDLSEPVMARELFWQMTGTLDSVHESYNQELLQHYLSSSYRSHVLLGIRRQLKSKPGKISLLGILEDIQENVELITFDMYRSLYPFDFDRSKLELQFAEYSRGENNFISINKVNDDINLIKKLFITCEAFTDKRIAHFDKKKGVVPPTIRDIEDCLETVKITCNKYYFLLKAQHAEYLPDYRKPDLKAIFPEVNL